ncbi:MAG: single-stranded DNA-binding protein [Propionibacteriaceae bacterium]|jgi:single-strand DNA-binding protein|nr:single-stranded DNA-binding protein [Propionibacteriaceae bacterium]
MDSIITMNGLVGGEVDFRQHDGYQSASFRLGCTPRVWRSGGWQDDETTWMTVRCSGRLAEGVRASFRKGDPVLVTGRVRTRKYEREGRINYYLYLDATTAGHDVTWGTSTFNRVSRARPAEPTTEAAPAEANIEMATAEFTGYTEPPEGDTTDYDSSPGTSAEAVTELAT